MIKNSYNINVNTEKKVSIEPDTFVIILHATTALVSVETMEREGSETG